DRSGYLSAARTAVAELPGGCAGGGAPRHCGAIAPPGIVEALIVYPGGSSRGGAAGQPGAAAAPATTGELNAYTRTSARLGKAYVAPNLDASDTSERSGEMRKLG